MTGKQSLKISPLDVTMLDKWKPTPEELRQLRGEPPPVKEAYTPKLKLPAAKASSPAEVADKSFLKRQKLDNPEKLRSPSRGGLVSDVPRVGGQDIEGAGRGGRGRVGGIGAGKVDSGAGSFVERMKRLKEK